MRNILQYPITDDEIVETLETLSQQLLSLNLCGDIRPSILAEAVLRLSSRPGFVGDTSTPLGLAAFYEHQGRQKGKTLKLVDSIPNERIVIIIHAIRWAEQIRQLIKQRRPEYKINNITFVVWDHTAGQKLRDLRLRCPVFFDNAVLDNEAYKLVKDTNRVYGPNGVDYFAER